MWTLLAGLAPITTVITVGQELVVPGEEVDVVLESEDPEGTGTGMIGAVPDPETADTQRNSQAHTPS